MIPTMNRARLRIASAACLAVLALSGSVLAHHGNAAYDLDKPITLKGTVTEFAWSNPHVQIYFDVKDSKGKVVHWASETVSPGMLVRSGWSKDLLKPGEEITITVGPAKNGSPIGYALKIILPSGKEVVLGQGRDTNYNP